MKTIALGCMLLTMFAGALVFGQKQIDHGKADKQSRNQPVIPKNRETEKARQEFSALCRDLSASSSASSATRVASPGPFLPASIQTLKDICAKGRTVSQQMKTFTCKDKNGITLVQGNCNTGFWDGLWNGVDLSCEQAEFWCNGVIRGQLTYEK